MNENNDIMAYLAVGIREIIKNMTDYEAIREIRLRAGKPLVIEGFGEETFVDGQGRKCSVKEAYIVKEKDIKETVEYISNYSMYSVEEELKNGFITMSGGNRAGICGKVVCDNDKIRTIRNVSSVNIRIAHEIKGCSDRIMEELYDGQEVRHTLIVSPPCCGKTTLLRDIIRNISNGNSLHKGKTVGVVDERSEIAACSHGIPQNDIGVRTDVLDACPKYYGMNMLIRSMAPDVIAVDEIGGEKDIEAISYAINCGCKIIATIHAASIEELQAKPYVNKMLQDEIFERMILLCGQPKAGTVKAVYNRKGCRI